MPTRYYTDLNSQIQQSLHEEYVIGSQEPLPTRIATLALGAGDIDCVYHFVLSELKAAIEELDNQYLLEPLVSMIEGKRLRDISDLPFDLAV
jgi:hypothetical protein